jgi:hypothetical protein
VFDPQSDRWTRGPGLNYDPPRKGASFDHVTSVLSAPANAKSSGFSETGLQLPNPRRAFAGAVLSDAYYMVGGMRGDFELVPECTVFHFDSQRFDAMPCPKAARLSGSLVELGGRLYLAGGSVQTEHGIESDRSIEVFDPTQGSWQTLLASVPFDTRQARVLAYGDRLLIVSTQRADARIQLALVAPR